MSSRTLLNLALMAIAAVLALVIVYQPGITPEPAPQTVTTVGSEKISHIRVTRTTREPLAFTRRGDSWFLVNHHDLPASDFQVNSLLATLQAEAMRSYPADSIDPAELGLQPPLATLTLGDTEIKIGTTDALDKLRYLQAGDTVYMVTDRYQHLVNADWPGFVSRKLLPAGARISELKLPQTTLSLTAGNQWQQFPAHATTEPPDLQALVDNWQQASATYIRRYQPSGNGETVTVTLSGNPDPLTFNIVTRTPELVLARPDLGIQYHLQGEMDKALLATPAN